MTSRLFETTPAPASEDATYLRLPEVLRRIPVSKSTWWLGVKTGRFPASVKLGPRITAWHSDDIRRCIAELRRKEES